MKKKILLIVPILLIFTLFINVKAKEYTPEEIPGRSYVIGTHLFTRRPAEGSPYRGTLTTQWIMLASGTIMSAELEDRVIYYKDSEGNWYNAINDEAIAVEDFYIEYKDGVRIYDIPVPELAQDYNGPDEEHQTPDLFIVNGQVCGLLHINSAELADEIEGFTVYKADGTEIETSSDITAHITVCGDQGSSGTYYAKAIITGDEGAPVYGDKSADVEVEFTMDIPVPTLAQDYNGPDEEHQTPDLFVVGGQVCGLLHINSYELTDLVDGFTVYKADGTEIESSDDITAHITVCANQGTSYYAKTYKKGDDNSKAYSTKTDDVTVTFAMDIPVPTLAQDYNGPDEEHQTPDLFVVGGQVCGLLHINSYELTDLVDGFTVYKADGTEIESSDDITAHITVCANQGTSYYAKTYKKGDDNSKVYSTKTDDVTVTFAMDIPVPTLAQDYNGPDEEHQTPDLFVVGGQVCGLLHINSYELTDLVDGFTVYKADGTEIETSSDITAHITVCANQGTSYYAKTYKKGDDNSKVYSTKTDDVTVTFAMDIPVPTLAQDLNGPDMFHQSYEYILNDNGKVCTNLHITNGSDLENAVDGFVVYKEDGTVFATPATLDSAVLVCDTNKTQVSLYAKAYKLGADNSKVYSTASSAVTIDFSELHLVTAQKIDSTNRPQGDPEELLNNINKYSVMKVADDTISVTDIGIVPYIGGNQTTEKKWVGIIVDFGFEVQGTGYTIEAIDRQDAISWGATSNTAFVLWTITDSNRTITFTDVNDSTRTFELKINFEVDQDL